MATLRFFLDTRAAKGRTAPLKLAITHDRKVRYLNLEIALRAEYWDGERVTKACAHEAMLNALLSKVRAQAENELYSAMLSGKAFDAEDLRIAIMRACFPSKAAQLPPRDAAALVEVFEQFSATKKQSTRLTYDRTLKHLKTFEPKWEKLKFEDVTRSWLLAFDAHMATSAPSPNARAIHMRNLRAVFNFAIDENLTTHYPFRRFKIKTIKTVKRSLSVEKLREFMIAEVADWQEPYRDFFVLSFLLIGMNPADLLRLKPSAVNAGRIEYNRAKTGRLYSIRIEQEAQKYIDKLRGRQHLLRFMDERADYLQFVRQTNHALKLIGTRCQPGKKPEGEALCPGVSLYWARHSWATIARKIGISVDDIALALGHGDGHDLTHIYLDEDLLKVDEANRRVIDYVFHGVR